MARRQALFPGDSEFQQLLHIFRFLLDTYNFTWNDMFLCYLKLDNMKGWQIVCISEGFIFMKWRRRQHWFYFIFGLWLQVAWNTNRPALARCHISKGLACISEVGAPEFGTCSSIIRTWWGWPSIGIILDTSLKQDSWYLSFSCVM